MDFLLYESFDFRLHESLDNVDFLLYVSLDFSLFESRLFETVDLRLFKLASGLEKVISVSFTIEFLLLSCFFFKKMDSLSFSELTVLVL